MLQVVRCGVLGLRFWLEGSGFGVWGLGFGVWSVGCGVWVVGFQISGFEFGAHVTRRDAGKHYVAEDRQDWFQLPELSTELLVYTQPILVNRIISQQESHSRENCLFVAVDFNGQGLYQAASERRGNNLERSKVFGLKAKPTIWP